MPVCVCNCCKALVQMSKTVGEIEAQVVLPPLPGPGGKFVSPTRTVICSGLRPSISAATTAMTVRVPVPMSCTPRRNSMLPSGLICASPCVLRLAAASGPRRARAADAGFHDAGRTAGLLIFFVPAKFFRAQLVFALADFVRIIFQAEFQRIHAES